MPKLAEGALPAFFQQAREEHAAAARREGERERRLRFGDRGVRLRFAGPALVDRLLPALAPRIDARPAAHEVTAGLWEERASPIPSRDVPWRDTDVGPRGLVRAPAGANVMAVHETGSGAITLIDRRARSLLYRVPDAARLPWWERAAPLRPALFWALTGEGRHLVHAGAVGDGERGGALVAGAGGSGKTTVALAALEAGLRYVSDDYVLLHSQPELVAWNLYGTAKLDRGHLARFPTLAEEARVSPAPEADEKAVLDVAASRPGAVAEALPIRAVIVPRIEGGRTRLDRVHRSKALLALAPSTAFQIPFDDGAVVRSLATVVRRVPCFALSVGDRPAEIAQAVDRVLEISAPAAPASTEPVPGRAEVAARGR